MLKWRWLLQHRNGANRTLIARSVTWHPERLIFRPIYNLFTYYSGKHRLNGLLYASLSVKQVIAPSFILFLLSFNSIYRELYIYTFENLLEYREISVPAFAVHSKHDLVKIVAKLLIKENGFHFVSYQLRRTCICTTSHRT